MQINQSNQRLPSTKGNSFVRTPQEKLYLHPPHWKTENWHWTWNWCFLKDGMFAGSCSITQPFRTTKEKFKLFIFPTKYSSYPKVDPQLGLHGWVSYSDSYSWWKKILRHLLENHVNSGILTISTGTSEPSTVLLWSFRSFFFASWFSGEGHSIPTLATVNGNGSGMPSTASVRSPSVWSLGGASLPVPRSFSSKTWHKARVFGWICETATDADGIQALAC